MKESLNSRVVSGSFLGLRKVFVSPFVLRNLEEDYPSSLELSSEEIQQNLTFSKIYSLRGAVFLLSTSLSNY